MFFYKVLARYHENDLLANSAVGFLVENGVRAKLKAGKSKVLEQILIHLDLKVPRRDYEKARELLAGNERFSKEIAWKDWVDSVTPDMLKK